MEEPALNQEVLAALDEIDRILHQMLMLAELSASDGEINRPNLQIVLEHLQHKIGFCSRNFGASQIQKDAQPTRKLSSI